MSICYVLAFIPMYFNILLYDKRMCFDLQSIGIVQSGLAWYDSLKCRRLWYSNKFEYCLFRLVYGCCISLVYCFFLLRYRSLLKKSKR